MFENIDNFKIQVKNTRNILLALSSAIICPFA